MLNWPVPPTSRGLLQKRCAWDDFHHKVNIIGITRPTGNMVRMAMTCGCSNYLTCDLMIFIKIEKVIMMFSPIGKEALFILRCLNRTSMTMQQLSENLNSIRILGPTEPVSGSINREIRLLQRWGLIKWARHRTDFERVYHITEAGRRFFRDYLFIAASNSFEEYQGITSGITNLDALEKNKRIFYINRHREFVYQIIGKIKKSQASLGKREKARHLLLQYHLYRFQGELGWLDGISGSKRPE